MLGLSYIISGAGRSLTATVVAMTDRAERIREVLRTGTERERALAIRSVCVCHGSWEVFRELEADLRCIAQEDSSHRVRQQAKHVLDDPLVENIHEDEVVRRELRQVSRASRRNRKRAAREARSAKMIRRR